MFLRAPTQRLIATAWWHAGQEAAAPISAAEADELQDDIEMSEDDMGRPAAPMARTVRKVSSAPLLSLPHWHDQAASGCGARQPNAHTSCPTEAHRFSVTPGDRTLHHHSYHSVVCALCSGSGRWGMWI